MIFGTTNLFEQNLSIIFFRHVSGNLKMGDDFRAFVSSIKETSFLEHLGINCGRPFPTLWSGKFVVFIGKQGTADLKLQSLPQIGDMPEMKRCTNHNEI